MSITLIPLSLLEIITIIVCVFLFVAWIFQSKRFLSFDWFCGKELISSIRVQLFVSIIICVKMDGGLDETKDKFIKKKRNHILKRIKKHFGIVRREPGSCSNQNNLPPLQFHNVHGDNIRISRDGSIARRFESFCRALTFSSRPVRINERIFIRFSEISNNWNGGIRFGFTNNDPASLENSLPKYACPDLTNRPGFWAKALSEQYCELDNVLHYFVNSSGDVIYGINGEEKGVILSGIDIHGLIWTVIDIYGNCTAIELLDARLFSQQNSPQSYSTAKTTSNISNCLIGPLQPLALSEEDRYLYGTAKMPNNTSNCLIGPLQSLALSDENMPLQYNKQALLVPFEFHTTKGRNVLLSTDRLIASRADADFCQGYVFTSRPIEIGEQYVIQIMKTDPSYVGALAFGVTSCNPDSLNQVDLPTDSNCLLDRPEYWIVSKDIALPCKKGDEIAFNLSSFGQISVSKNHGLPSLVLHVDHRLRLWAFFDIYGSTQSLRLFYNSKMRHPQVSIYRATTPIPEVTTQSSIRPPQSSTSNASLNIIDATTSPTILKRLETSLAVPNVGKMVLPSHSDIKIHSGGTVLVVNLPPANLSHSHNFEHKDESKTNCTTTAYIHDPKNSNKNLQHLKPEASVEKKKLESECTICYEKNIDSVLYMCGHMCMCYNCALEQWRGVGGGQCPLCRAVIRDVIRTYTT